ncbi:anthranilate synthase component II [Peribacillus sp. SCS-155]|uniref:anthranilate synthase component II n=1 Tax=Peribacillus sedimenti TaxID=3115297 RepID=UPI0039064F77
MILLIDNYDSFTYNLYQYIGEIDEDIVVRRNDEITLEEIAEMKPEMIILSPGPGRPENAGVCIPVINKFFDKIPLLGVCLGHQAIGAAFGANITAASKICHGKTSDMVHNGEALFANLPSQVEVMRYHSLVIEREAAIEDLDILARDLYDGEIMAVKHSRYPVYGVQFHPESIGTADGREMIKNFIEIARGKQNNETISAKVV